MANNHHQGGEVHPNSQDFIDQLLDMQNYATASGDVPNLGGGGGIPMMLQLSGGFHAPPSFPLGLSLDQANPNSKPAFLNLKPHHGHGDGECEASSVNPARFRHPPPPLDAPPKNVFHGQPMPSPVPAAPQQPAVRQRVRARRGQATDPHSIAERLRRERIAERIRALQELVPSVNKTDRAAMLDEIVDYVKFLRLQVKVLSMSRLGGAGAVVPLVTDIPISSVEEEGGEGGQGQGQPMWEKWSNDGTERQVTKLMEENVGAAMQFLQSKALCIMPISLASAIYHTQPPDSSSHIKPESNPPS